MAAVEHRGVHVDVHEGAVGGDRRRRARVDVAEVGAEHERRVDARRRVAARPPRRGEAAVAERARVLLGDDPLGARRGHEGDVERVEERAHTPGVATRPRADHHEGTRGRREEPRGLAHGVRGRGRRGAHREARERRGVGGLARDVHRNDEERGALAVRRQRGLERREALRGRRRRARDAHRGARDGREHRFDREPLGSAVLHVAPPRRGPRDVARDHEHGDGLRRRCGDARERVGRARSRGHQHRGDAARGAVMAHRREGRGRLMARGHEARAGRREHRFEDRAHGSARDAEEGLDPLGDERLDEVARGRARGGSQRRRRGGARRDSQRGGRDVGRV